MTDAYRAKLITPELFSKVDPRLRETALSMLEGPGFDEISAEDLRSMMEFMVREEPLPVEDLRSVSDINIPGPDGFIPLRIYTPVGDGPFPVMIYLHGGGWIAGNLDTQDSVCRLCCGASKFIVVSVDYRLGPEHKFPAAPEDCYAAACWIASNAHTINGDASRLILSGESAGGNLAAAVCLMARDRQGPSIQHQVIICGALQQPDWHVAEYLERDQIGHPYASPLLAPSLQGMPSATIIAAECDTVTPQGIEYARRLNEAGIETHFCCYKGMIHGFLSDESLEATHNAVKDIADLARRAIEH